jgi:hypothetical protein
MEHPPAKPPVPPELQTIMDAEFEFAGLKSVDSLVDLHADLSGTTGVVSAEIIAGRLAVRYDPEEITAAEISNLIRHAGFELATSESAPSAPPIEPSESAQHFESPAG